MKIGNDLQEARKNMRNEERKNLRIFRKKAPETKNEPTIEWTTATNSERSFSLCGQRYERHLYADAKLYSLNTIIIVCVCALSLSTASESEWKNIWFKSYYRGKCDSHVTS